MSLQFFSEKTASAADAYLYGSRRDAQRIGNFLVRLLFDECQRSRDLQLRRKPAERTRNFPAKLLGDARVRQRRRRQIVGEISLRARGLEVIECSVGSDTSRPCPEAARGVEAGVRAMDAPEGFDREVFGGSRVADDANDPTLNLTLMPTEQRLKGVEVAVTELP